MKIESILIQNLYGAGMKKDMEEVVHQKTLPCLSVVQAQRGSYDIALDEGETLNTGEGGVFLAPAGARQRITHHNGAEGVIEAHWVYMDVIINRFYRLDSLFRLPVLLDRAKEKEVCELIEIIRCSENICKRYAAAYGLTDILLESAGEAEEPDPNKMQLQQFVARHFSEKIGARELAEVVHCSVPQVFRYTRKYFNLSPANYINEIRLQNAARLLESSPVQIKEAAFSSGFDDVAYFSRLFKKSFGLSPSEYRAGFRGKRKA